MQYQRIGNTDLVPSALGFGTWEMGGTDYGETDVSEATTAVRSAIDSGITLFDTAEAYGPYRSEEILGRALGTRRKDVILVTKVGYAISEEGELVGRDSRRESVIASAEGSLKRLGTGWIDLLLIHVPDHDTSFAETIGALEELKAAGKIRHYGVSNFSVEMMEEWAQYGELATVQVGYHMFDRRVEAAMLPHCLRKRIGVMAYGTLGYGLLAGLFTPETTFESWDWRSYAKAFGLPLFERESFLKELRVVEQLKEIAARYEKTVAQLAIAWVLGHPAVSVALVGMRSPAELRENIQAVGWEPTAEDRSEIDRIFEGEGVPTYVDAPLIE